MSEVQIGQRQGARAEAAALWRDRLARQSSSGLSVAEFCRQEQVNEVSFYYWRRRLQAAGKSVGSVATSQAFVPIEVVTGNRFACEVIIDRLVCRLSQELDDDSFRRVIRLLREEASR